MKILIITACGGSSNKLSFQELNSEAKSLYNDVISQRPTNAGDVRNGGFVTER